ncbi:MAG: RNA polymerase factor sigma-54 [Anaerolineales bacterium]
MFPSQRQTISHKTLVSIHLTQSMNLLTLNTDELRENVRRALAENPALEIIAAPRCPACGRAALRPGLCPLCARNEAAQTIVFTSPISEFSPHNGLRRGDPYAEKEEAESAETPSLAAHLLRQIAPELTCEERPIAAHLLAGLDDDGLLTTSPLEIATYFHVAPSRVEALRRRIQESEPLGCASLNAREALQLQLDMLENVPPAARACLEEFELFSRKKFSELANKTGLEEESLRQAAQFIAANLNPYPARAWWPGNPAPQTAYRTPDVLIHPLDERPEAPLVIEIAQAWHGLLRVNPRLRAETPVGEASPAWRETLEQAGLLVKALRQRASALEMLMGRIAALQRDFILRGDAWLQPLTRAQLAQDLCLHESTISRAVASKTAQLPNGKIVPLARFFERNLNIRAALKALVDEEASPLNDDELAARLQGLGFPVARRTVAKYRELEHIPPARQRPARQGLQP